MKTELKITYEWLNGTNDAEILVDALDFLSEKAAKCMKGDIAAKRVNGSFTLNFCEDVEDVETEENN